MKQIILDLGVLRIFGWDVPFRIYGYGLMLVLGFLIGIYLAKRRAKQAGEDPEQIAYLGMLALIGGLIGARAAYVIEQAAGGRWDEFVGDGDGLLVSLNITSGGLIYYGGVILAAIAVLVYLRLKRLPVRRYLDILSVSLLVGLAFGRAGCLLNGCCYGARCAEDWPLAAHFPMFSTPLLKINGFDNPFSSSSDAPSPAYGDQFVAGLVTPDDRLWGRRARDGEPIAATGRYLRSPRYLHGRLDRDQLKTMFMDSRQAQALFKKLAGPTGLVDEQRWQAGLKDPDGFLRGGEFWLDALNFDANGDMRLSFQEAWDYLQWRRAALTARFDADGDGRLGVSEAAGANEYLQADLYAPACAEHASAVKPAQALAMLNALVLAALLTLYYPIRRREGQVFALAMTLYPLTRFMEELIRADNYQGVFRLTHNQYTSIALFAVGAIMMLALRRLNASCGPASAQRQAAGKR